MIKGLKTVLIIIVAVVILVLGLVVGYSWALSNMKCDVCIPCDQCLELIEAKIKQSKNENIDLIIKDMVLGMSAPEITDVEITNKKFYADSNGTLWSRFHLNPIPENSADPAYGVIKKELGKDWITINFGTSGIEDDLSTEIQNGLEF